MDQTSIELVDLGPLSPAAAVAGDEALLDWAEENGPAGGLLRIWETDRPIVVVGRGSRVEREVVLEACRREGVPIVRRPSGGAAIVSGPGCLMYALILGFERRDWLRSISAAHAHVLGRTHEAVIRAMKASAPSAAEISRLGTSDLAILSIRDRPVRGAPSEPAADELREARKFSGNSLRLRRNYLLYHGTLLYGFDISLISRYLRMPPRSPSYRHGRDHSAFVGNLPVAQHALRTALLDVWQATSAASADWQSRVNDRIEQLVATRYGSPRWNLEGHR